MIALLGNLSRDILPGEAPRVGGGAFHGARALRELHVPARVYARCALEDRDALLGPLVRLGTPVTYVPGTATAGFSLSYDGDRRSMRVEALGDAWRPEELPVLPDAVRWLHVSPLARSDFPAETLAALARGRRVSFDGQGLVRAPGTGELRLNADYDPELLRHVWALKLSEEEAEVVGNPAALGVPEVVVTHGSRGATLYAEGKSTRIPAHPLDGDPTGAGDAFAVAYVAARSSGSPPAAAAHRATTLVASLLVAA